MPLTIQNLASRLTFRQLQVFKAVYDLKNYSKAGELLGLTQPAISSQVRHLEQALGLPMFEYVGRKLYCTAAGEEMAKCVRSVFAALEKMQNNLAALEGQVAGELRLVAVNTAQYVVPYMLGAFLQLNPQVTVSVSVVNRATALQRLNDNADDLVIMGMVPAERPLTSLPFWTTSWCRWCPRAIRYLGKRTSTLRRFWTAVYWCGRAVRAAAWRWNCIVRINVYGRFQVWNWALTTR